MSAFGMMIAASLAAAVQGEPVPQARIQNVPLATIDIPDEIAPAITPYFDCRMASLGVRRGPPGTQAAPPPEQLGADCSETRLEAARRAEARLRDRHRGTAAERRAYVERILGNVDTFAAAAAAPMLPSGAAQAGAESRRLYEPYRQCLFGQAILLAGPEGETSGLDQARTRCMAQNLSAGTNALFAEMRSGASQDEAGERVGALRISVEREAVARARANPNNRPD